MSSPGPSSGTSSGTSRPAELFEDLWRQLGQCHQSALEELEAKVSKLKKERCLDAQRLEVFYNRNQQLKEQNKTLQDAVSLLEDRLRAGECDHCTILEENLKNIQDQNLHLITKLKNERNSLEDENRKLHDELQKLKMSGSELQQASTPDQEEGIIPDSPVLPSSLPVVNKLKKLKKTDKASRVRYAELPLPQANNSLFRELNKEPVDASKNPGRAEVLVPNTCDLDTSQTSNAVDHDVEEAIAETCGLEFVEKHHVKTETTAGQQRSLKNPWRNNVRLNLVHSPDSSTERSPSLLPRLKRLSEDGSINTAKRKKEESEPGVQEGEGEHVRSEPTKQTSTSSSSQSFMKPLDRKVQSVQNGASSQRPDVSCASPDFKKPNGKVKGDGGRVGKKRHPLQDLSTSHDRHEAEDAERKHRVEPMWSIDPALALSMHDSEWRGDEEKEEPCPGELEDTDCTWVSHSVLQDRRDSVSGLGVKVNDSLDLMFDITAYGEYKSCNSSHLGQSQACDEEEEEEDEDEDCEPGSPENTSGQSKAQREERADRLQCLDSRLICMFLSVDQTPDVCTCGSGSQERREKKTEGHDLQGM
ncbi:DNA endonuclease RBBP8 isoform X2 [Toxotes jaculatrix]|uniref:DNA endonuclease RBBP8 isoform X2 n=1 Tax=Toxotes jaculatrix TaxID=941984 RepID=UPI001B3AECEE|nr:DNA endonuclease RBBP8 isoform X2 [Toxotes jaculatrix]